MSCLGRGVPQTLTDVFSNGAPGGPIHKQINGTRKQTCTHPRTTGTKEQVSDCLSEFVLVSRVDPDPEKGPLFAQKRGQSPFNEPSVHEIRANQSQGPQRLGKQTLIALHNPFRFSGYYSGNKKAPFKRNLALRAHSRKC
ncbi:hypothetical protein CDL15_Pgr014139 [Punica granatum]|uniref:Uncharacterized protein n=1 Tax=Punica granatum TaxID=22663 RepID=A0A218Y0I0_PUNGR|nr:hypothetical protein CDL15_Pgr014139 [Punica granatum]